jgi:anti-anti-sigma regulatory factor
MTARAEVGDPGTVDVLALHGAFSRREARELGRDVHERLRQGRRRLVVDLTGATSIVEGALVLTLLGVRADLERCGGRLVVAAPPEVAGRLARSLRLDEVLGACASRDQAMRVAGTRRRSRAERTLACAHCQATWHPGQRELALVLATSCPRCGGPLQRR